MKDKFPHSKYATLRTKNLFVLSRSTAKIGDKTLHQGTLDYVPGNYLPNQLWK